MGRRLGGADHVRRRDFEPGLRVRARDLVAPDINFEVYVRKPDLSLDGVLVQP